MSTTQPIRDIEDVRKLTNYYLNLGQHRNHLLIVFGLYSALRIGDMLPIVWGDVYDFGRSQPKAKLTLKEQKTGKVKTLALNEHITKALQQSFSKVNPLPGSFLFANPHTNQPITRIQARRIIVAAGQGAKLPYGVSCHSLRKTFGYHAWRRGVSPAVLMEIYNHSSLNHTRRYLGVAQDDLDTVYLWSGF